MRSTPCFLVCAAGVGVASVARAHEPLPATNAASAADRASAAPESSASGGRFESPQGFYASVSLGPGLLFAGTDSSTDARTFEGSALAFSAAMGGRFGRHVAFGGAYVRDQVLGISVQDEVVDGDEPDLDDIGFSFDRVGLFLAVYPIADAGLNFQGFVGYGDFNAHRPDGDEADDPSGFVFSLAGGHEWLVSERVHVGGLLRLTYAPLDVDELGIGQTDVDVFAPTVLVTATYF